MTNEEKLREYLRKNTEKEVVAPEEPQEQPATGKSHRSPISWYNSSKIKGIFIITRFLTFFPFCILAWLNSEQGIDIETCVLAGVIIWVTGMTLNVGINVYQITRYNTWVNNGFYKLTGWNEFFANRSAKYWGRGRHYVNTRITFNLAQDATDVQREVIKVFTADIVKAWNKDHDEMDWEPGKGSPKNFSTDGKAISGDISERELRFIIKALIPRFVPLSKLIGPKLLNVTISAKGEEREYFVTEEKDDPHDRATSWANRHGD